MDIRFGATVISQERNPNFRAHRPNDDEAAPAPLGEFRAEMVGDVQMRHRIEPQSRLKQLPIELQKLARIWGAGIGDDKADVEIVCSPGKPRKEVLLRQIHRKDAAMNPEVGRDTACHLLKHSFPSGYKHYVDPCGRDLPRKFLAYSGRGTRDKCPGAESLFIECCSHLFAPFCLIRACCVINYSAANGRGFISGSEYRQNPICHSSDHLVTPVLCQWTN